MENRRHVSPSSRRAWIEIDFRRVYQLSRGVALLAEGVDRNNMPIIRLVIPVVALLAEGVDRNKYLHGLIKRNMVALLAEGVDRNLVQFQQRQ